MLAVLPDDRLAAVAGLPVDEVRPGERVYFLVGPGRVVTGVVLTSAKRNLHVRYDPPPAGTRPPDVDDVAAYVPPKPAAPSRPPAPPRATP